MLTNSAIRIMFAALAAACSPAGAEQPSPPSAAQPSPVPVEPSLQAGADENWRCVARPDYFREREGGASATTRVISGKLVFHSVTPSSNATNGASIHFMSLAADPDMRHGNGLTAVILNSDPGTIQLYMAVDGQATKFGSVPVSQPVPFTLTYDDRAGTVTLEAATYRKTAKPVQMQRPHFDMKCSGTDVSFADLAMVS